MRTFTVVYYEVTRIKRTVKAVSLDSLMEKLPRIQERDGWRGCDEETLGTNGVEEVFDADGKRVYDAGTRAGYAVECDCNERSWHGDEHDSACVFAGEARL